MTTRETLEKLPANVRHEIELRKSDYKRFPTTAYSMHMQIRATINGYLRGLRDAGLITERERQVLFVYTTV